MDIDAGKSKHISIFIFLVAWVCWLLPHTSFSFNAWAAGKEQNRSGGAFVSVSPEEAAELMRTREDLAVVDVRTLKERKRAAIKGSIHIPMDDIFRGEVELSPERPILLYCAVGGRSRSAAIRLQQKGFTELYNLRGGIVDWIKAGLPVEGEI